MPIARPRTALVWSGLAGSVLAALLGPMAAMVVCERGPNWLERPLGFETAGQPLGLTLSLNNSLGSTTHLWHCGMLEMPPGKLGAAWPEAVRSELAPFCDDVVTKLYYDAAVEAWARRAEVPLADDTMLTSIFYPGAAYRAAASKRFDNCDLRRNETVVSVEQRVGGVSVINRSGDGTAAECFDCVFLAGSNFNSPLVLNRSGLGGPAVGQNCTDHPIGFVAKLRGRDVRNVLKRPSGADNSKGESEPLVKLQDAESGLWSAFYLLPAAGRSLRSDPYAAAFGLLGETATLPKYEAALPQMTDPDFLHQAIENQFGIQLASRYGYVLIINEQEALGQGRISETKAGGIQFNWQISDKVDGAIRRNLNKLSALLEAERIPWHGAMRERLWSAAHHSRSCRMARDSARGVADETLKVHGIQTVFVCDGSVLPSTGCTSTGLTISALCHRLVRHLRTELAMASDRPKPTARGRSEGAVEVLVSGAGARVGQMIRGPLVASGKPWQAVDLCKSNDPPAARIFLHLANAHDDTEANAALQRCAAEAVDKAGVNKVTVTKSFVTLSKLGVGEPDRSAVNFGFACTSLHSYPHGKLAAEPSGSIGKAARPTARSSSSSFRRFVGPNRNGPWSWRATRLARRCWCRRSSGFSWSPRTI